MRTTDDVQAVDAVRAAARPLRDERGDHDALLELIGDAHFVLLGEASHGTHEFYRERARITRRLIEEKGFHAVAIEGDWPDAHRVNRFVRDLGDDAFAVEALAGFTTHSGSVTAASDWGGPAERKRIVASLPGSYEALMHATGLDRFMLSLRHAGRHTQALLEPRLERAIGVIYRRDTERQSHYFYAQLPAQFDALLHFDETRAVEPLERNAEWSGAEAPETFPSGM